MLERIDIKDFALIEAQTVTFKPGMTALTGETGAGKSIILDALGLVLGDRADRDSIRAGADRAEVQARFDVRQRPVIQAWLEAQGFEATTACVLRRTVSRRGSSRCSINQRSVPLRTLRELAAQLIDIHGQHAHQSLMQRDQQRLLLDQFGGHLETAQAVASHHRQWHELAEEAERLRAAHDARRDRLELLGFQLTELHELGLQPGEWPELEAEHRRLAHAGSLRALAEQALEELYEREEAPLSARLGRLAHQLEDASEHDARLGAVQELLHGALAQIEEAADSLRDYRDGLALDPERLALLEARIARATDLARKHRVEPEALSELTEGLEAERQRLQTEDDRLEGLAARLAEAHEAYTRSTEALTQARGAAAERLGAAVTEAMQDLSMVGGRFEVSLRSRDGEQPHPDGAERVEFRISANPGQPLKPLTKVASGGELARMSLAIQMHLARQAAMPTLIFDEVDAGIGGAVAETVGTLLRGLGERVQVLCVTHLPQVAAQAHHHLRVSKATDPHGATHTRLVLLDGNQRTEEIARMLGGIEITAQTRAHAREMLTAKSP